MKKTDFDKNKALRLLDDLRTTATSPRFGHAATLPSERREQRKLDQSAGLVSFPVKLRQPIIDTLRARAAETNEPVNALLDKLLSEALGLASLKHFKPT